MNELLAISNDTVRVVAWTLLHFFWQGALIAAALAAALALLRNSSSRVRYGAACLALVAMAAMPVATGSWLTSSHEATPVTPVTGEPQAAAAAAARPAPVAAEAVLGSSAVGSAGLAPRSALLDPTLPWLVALWLAGVVALAGVHLGGWVRVRRLRRRGVREVEQRWRRACARLARRLGIRRPVQLLASTRVAVPTVVGWLKPVVLFPASTFTGLGPRQLESILAHELAHVRRHDYLINLLQVALETLLFYHPAVWWASRQARELREHCCDDLAVQVCGDRMVYARALAELEELRFATPVFALGADGGSLLERIRRLAGRTPSEARTSGWLSPALAAVALTASAVLLAFAGQPGFAQEEEVGLVSPTFLPPMILAQLSEQEQGSSSVRPEAARPASTGEPAGAEARSRDPIPLDDLIEMKMHGLDDLLDEVEGTAYAGLPTGQLLEMARFGVDRELIAELDAAGYRDLQAPELVELAKFGVDGELIAELQAVGLGQLSVAELVELAKFGVDGDYVQEMTAASFEPSFAGLVELAKFGVDEELIRELADAGFGGLQAPELVELAKFGVDGDYVGELRGAGYQVTSVAELVELAKFGVDEELIGELAGAGFGDLPAVELVELAKFGVDGDYLQEMTAAGYAVTSIPELVELAKFGVDEELVAELAELGYRDLAAEELVELAKFGVDGDFVRELRAAGYENLSVEDLARMARHGIDAEFLSKMDKRRP